MNKNAFIKDLAKKFDLPQSKANAIISSILETITKSLVKGDAVKFIGFGNFSVKKRKERQGCNPQTGKAIKIPAHKVVRFSVGADLKQAVNKK